MSSLKHVLFTILLYFQCFEHELSISGRLIAVFLGKSLVKLTKQLFHCISVSSRHSTGAGFIGIPHNLGKILKKDFVDGNFECEFCTYFRPNHEHFRNM